MSGVEGLPPGYLEYLRRQDEERLRAAEAILEKMTLRERALFREAAVMGFVQGTRAAGGIRKDDHPKDTQVTIMVVDAIRAFPDLYPVTSGLENEEGEG